MREQQAQIQNVFVADVEVIRELLCGPQDHNQHTKAWRWEAYLQDARLRAAAVREEALKIIARQRDRMEALQNEITQVAE